MSGKEYRTITDVKGPLVFLNKTEPVAFGEIVQLRMSDGSMKNGQVLDTSDELVIVQVFEGTAGVDLNTGVKFMGDVFKLPVSDDLIGRILDGAGRPRDDGPDIVAEENADIIGAAINPYSRQSPHDFIQTGISAIDCCTTLVRGQKLPIFSASGLPHNDIALQIARQAKLKDSDQEFIVVFCAMGITSEEYNFFRSDLERTGALEKAVLFVNLADDPAVERIITPRLALTAAEYLAFEKDYHVLVIYTDMTNYCDALRQIGAAREEVPGRRGYPGYMYTDLAMLYERAGIIKGKKGSITQFPILTMPGDDITHPIPDLSGYITEGQIVISRELHQAGIYPPINVLPSLSRLMGSCIGAKTTREDHKSVSDQMYAAYAQGRELRGLVAIVGEDALNERDKQLLDFSGVFEDKFLRQSRDEDRSIDETLDLCWTLMSDIDTKYLVRLDQKWIEKYHPDNKSELLYLEIKGGEITWHWT